MTNSPFSPRRTIQAVRHGLTFLANVMGQPTETTQREGVAGVVGLYLLHQQLTERVTPRFAPDHKLYKAVWSVLRQAPLLHIGGRAMWRPLGFLAQQLPIKTRSMTEEGAAQRQREWLKQLDADLPREVQTAAVQVVVPSSSLSSHLTSLISSHISHLVSSHLTSLLSSLISHLSSHLLVQVGTWSVRFASDLTNHAHKRQVRLLPPPRPSSLQVPLPLAAGGHAHAPPRCSRWCTRCSRRA